MHKANFFSRSYLLFLFFLLSLFFYPSKQAFARIEDYADYIYGNNHYQYYGQDNDAYYYYNYDNNDGSYYGMSYEEYQQYLLSIKKEKILNPSLIRVVTNILLIGVVLGAIALAM